MHCKTTVIPGNGACANMKKNIYKNWNLFMGNEPFLNQVR